MTIYDDPQDLDDLRQAIALLESPSVAIKLANLVGSPLEWGMSKLPNVAQQKIQGAVKGALQQSAAAALYTLDDAPRRAPSRQLHKLAAATSGAVSGFFGFAGLLVELPVSTTIMMRAVADIARSEGFSLTDVSVKAACIEVFAFGGKSADAAPTESAYYAARAALTDLTRHTTRELLNLTGKKSAKSAAIALNTTQAGRTLARVIDTVATRFGITVTEKMAAQIVPVIGALSGAAINTLFTHHYQNMATGHFIITRLEQHYGTDAIRAAYAELAAPESKVRAS